MEVILFKYCHFHFKSWSNGIKVPVRQSKFFKYANSDKRLTQTVCISMSKCVFVSCQHQQWISLFTSRQVHSDGPWRPPGPVSVGGECGRDLVSRQDTGRRPGATSSPDAPLQDQIVWRTHPETLPVYWGMDTFNWETPAHTGLHLKLTKPPCSPLLKKKHGRTFQCHRRGLVCEFDCESSGHNNSDEEPAAIFQFSLFRH